MLPVFDIMSVRRMFVIINEDCAKSGDSVVPFTDTEYYAEQILNLEICSTAADAKLVADALLTIHNCLVD